MDGLKDYEDALRKTIDALLPKIKNELYAKIESDNAIIKEQPSSDIIIKAFIDKYIDSILLKKQQERLDQLTDVRQQVIALQAKLNMIQRDMIISLLISVAKISEANLKKWLKDSAGNAQFVEQINIIIDHDDTPGELKAFFFKVIAMIVPI